MKESYRINVRFDLGNEKEALAAELLQELKERGCSQNRFIVEAVIRAVDGNPGVCKYSEDNLRRILREELKGVSLARAEPEKRASPASKELTSEQKAKTAASALSFLKGFGG